MAKEKLLASLYALMLAWFHCVCLGRPSGVRQWVSKGLMFSGCLRVSYGLLAGLQAFPGFLASAPQQHRDVKKLRNPTRTSRNRVEKGTGKHKEAALAQRLSSLERLRKKPMVFAVDFQRSGVSRVSVGFLAGFHACSLHFLVIAN